MKQVKIVMGGIGEGLEEEVNNSLAEIQGRPADRSTRFYPDVLDIKISTISLSGTQVDGIVLITYDDGSSNKEQDK